MKKQQLLEILSRRLSERISDRKVALKRKVYCPEVESEQEFSDIENDINTISQAIALLDDFIFKEEATTDMLIDYLIGDI